MHPARVEFSRIIFQRMRFETQDPLLAPERCLKIFIIFLIPPVFPDKRRGRGRLLPLHDPEGTPGLFHAAATALSPFGTVEHRI